MCSMTERRSTARTCSRCPRPASTGRFASLGIGGGRRGAWGTGTWTASRRWGEWWAPTPTGCAWTSAARTATSHGLRSDQAGSRSSSTGRMSGETRRGVEPVVHVDIAALRSIEREKEISFETLMDALETALLTAYKHTPHSMPHARVAIDRKSAEVVVSAPQLGPAGHVT